jgi:hypothetical protein
MEQPKPNPDDLVEIVKIELERAGQATDEDRLQVLDDLYQRLEAELEEDRTARQ